MIMACLVKKNVGCSIKAGRVGSQFNMEEKAQKKIGQRVNTVYFYVAGLWVIICILFNSVPCLQKYLHTNIY